MVISNYNPEEKRVKADIGAGKLAYVKKVALPSESGTSVQGDQSANPAGDNSSDKGNNKSGKNNLIFREANENQEIFVSNAAKALEGMGCRQLAAEQSP